VTEAKAPAFSAQGAAQEPPLCRNCGVPAPGHYCSACGQSTKVHVPSLAEFLHEVISHHVALEGTLIASLKRLLLTPGGLTLDYFAGKRARYVAPLRLYLTFNVIFFLAVELMQFFGGAPKVDPAATAQVVQQGKAEAAKSLAEVAIEVDRDKDLPDDQRKAISAKLSALQLAAARGETASTSSVQDSDQEIDISQGRERAENLVLSPWIDDHLPSIRKRVDAFVNLSSEDKVAHLTENMVHYAPYTLLGMLPVCALLLQISFVGSHRRYVEHLVVALHGHTFLFIVLLTSLLPLGTWFGLILTLALVHMVLALRTIYSVGWISLMLRLSFFTSGYGLAFFIATLIALTASIIT